MEAGVADLVAVARRGGGEMNLKRYLSHLLYPSWRVRTAFPTPTLRAIESAIHAAEQRHDGEIRFAIEGALDTPQLWRGTTAHVRAIEVFAHLHVWDTAANNGVLVYLLLADRQVEIVADRGVHAKIGAAGWEAVCQRMEDRLRQGEFEAAALEGVAQIAALMTTHYPASGNKTNELDNWPVVVRR
jgi:uncharacterized membrane protein